MVSFINTNNHNAKEHIIMNDSESRDLVTTGSNEEIPVSKRSQRTFQVLNEEEDENISQ